MAGQAEPTLAQRVKAKYPGVYDALPDAELESRVRAKYPGIYDHVPRTPAAPPAAPSAPASQATAPSTIGDIVGGLRSSAARTVYGGGDLLRRGWNAAMPGERFDAARIIDQPGVQAAMQAPDSTAGRAASVAGDVAQFFLPTGVTKYKKAAEVAKSVGLTLAQTGSPMQAGISGAVAAVLPGVSAVAKAGPALRESAEKTMAQALGATTKPLKREAAKLVRPMLDRGIRGSRKAMLEQATAQTASLGAQLGTIYAQAAQAGATVPGALVVQTLAGAERAFTMAGPGGKLLAIPGTEVIRGKLGELRRFVGELGDEIPLDKAVHLKQTWDDIVSEAGLFGAGPTLSATDKAAKRALKAASDSFRTLINADPSIGALNQELSFWKGLRKVLTATKDRTQPQASSLTAAVMGGHGAAAGALSGDNFADRAKNAVIGGIAGRYLARVVESPAFRTRVAAPLKDQLADALASGQTGRVVTVLNRITAAAAAQFGNSPQ